MKMSIFKITVKANNYVTHYGFMDQAEMLKCLAEITNNKDGYLNKTVTIESDTVKVNEKNVDKGKLIIYNGHIN